jgi:hypothetical protein
MKPVNLLKYYNFNKLTIEKSCDRRTYLHTSYGIEKMFRYWKQKPRFFGHPARSLVATPAEVLD